MAEESSAKAQDGAVAPPPSEPAPKPTLYIALIVLNMLFIGGVGAMLYLNQNKKTKEATIDDVIRGEHEAQKEDHSEDKDFIGKLVPLETFLVNLRGSRGRKLIKINMELEVAGEGILDELDKRKPQIRDIIIFLVSSKTFDDISTRQGKEMLRDEIRDQVNPFLTKGQIKRVYFTDFIYN